MARRTRTALLVLVLALLAPTALGGLFGSKKAAATANNGEVLVIDGTDSFSAAVKAHDFLVVEFYAPVRAADPVGTHPPVGRHTRPVAGQAQLRHAVLCPAHNARCMHVASACRTCAGYTVLGRTPRLPASRPGLQLLTESTSTCLLLAPLSRPAATQWWCVFSRSVVPP